MIEAMHQQNIVDDLKNREHVWFDVPFEGGSAALAYQEESGNGYGLLAYLHEEEILDVSAIPAIVTSISNVGKIWTFYDEEAHVYYHAVYNHAIDVGYHPAFYPMVLARLDEWWEQHEEELNVVWPMRTVIFGSGRAHARVGEFRSIARFQQQILANTTARFAIFWEED